jgi:flagellar hook assembly protein FlgD
MIFFSTSIEAQIVAKIYDVRGRLVKHLDEIYSLPNRRESIRWSGLDDEGGEVPIGVYLLLIEATASNGRKEKVIPIVAAKDLD